MAADLEAYLDIETTGLSSYSRITVVGIYLASGAEDRFVQLVGDGVRADKVLDSLDGVSMLYTYNGTGFDLRLIKQALGLDLARQFPHRDLMFDCWRQDLRGGLKAVERQLGVPRKLKDVNGYQAVWLWHRYQKYGDYRALAKLLAYNKEDVLNLKVVKEKLMRKAALLPGGY